MSTTRTRLTATLSALALGAFALSAAATPAQAAERPDIAPLPDALETVRAAEAQELYGDPAIRPMEDRATSLITMGDSEISGEGVGNYEPDTHRDGNWCDRSYDQAVFRTGIASDVQYNVACSGGVSQNLIQGGQTQWDEMNQGDNLAIKARNTHIKLVWIVIGANDDGGIEFGPVATDCATHRVLFQGTCWEDHTDDWAARVVVSGQGVGNAIDGVRQTMTDAGYLGTDYDLVVMSYPSPVGPDVEDNPDYPGWLGGGCTMYPQDLAFARNKAVPMFDNAIRDAVLAKGVRYLNGQPLFDGHGVCEDNTWARGLHIEIPVLPSSNAFRQSFHPNYRGHGAFADCMTQFYSHPDWQTATCADPASTGGIRLYQGLMEHSDLKSTTSGWCVDAAGYDSRNGTALVSYGCHGGRNQGFWYDQEFGSFHVELSHDRCMDAGEVTAGTELMLWDCHGGDNQRFVVDGDLIHPAGAADLCVGFAGTGENSPLVLTDCTAAGTTFTMADRNYTDPVGYGHDDWIPAST